MKTDIEIKAMAFDLLLNSQKNTNRFSGSSFSSGMKAASDMLEITFNAIKTAEMLKAKKALPRVKCKGNCLYLPNGGSVDVMVDLLGPNDTLHVDRRNINYQLNSGSLTSGYGRLISEPLESLPNSLDFSNPDWTRS